MSFVSIAYLLFLPIVFVLYWWRPRWQNATLLAASLFFYGYWDVRFLLLMVLTALINYAVCLLPDGRRARWTAVGINMGILALFKYYDFFASELSWPMLHLVLPVGISFYTFQLTAYVIDVQRRHIEAERDPLRFLTFVCFFPQLVAGPIERAADLLPQIRSRRTFDYALAVSGMRLILWGLMKKMLLADNCATVADNVFAASAGCTATTADLWLGALCFTAQIYGDFSGYSDIAVGSARLFGIRLTRNFNLPYLSTTLPEFWRRWHVTLMSWLRDYIYIPLGGSRRGRMRGLANTLLVFLASGVWHGAAWTFMVWGVWHAVCFIPFRLAGAPVRRASRLVSSAVTLLVVIVGWVIFRADSLGAAAHYIAGMMTPADAMLTTTVSRLPLVWITLFAGAEALGGNCPVDAIGRLRSPLLRLAAYYLLFMLTLALGGLKENFIYFQF